MMWYKKVRKMKIEKMYKGFSGLVEIGKKGLYIKIGDTGIDREKELSTKIANNNNVFIYGKPFKYYQDLRTILTAVLKQNTNTHIVIYSDEIVQAEGLHEVDNIHYIFIIDTHRELQQKDLDYLNNKEMTDFVFNIKTKDDMDDIQMFLTKYNINKKKIWICYCEEFNNFNQVFDYTNNNDYNLTFDYYNLLNKEW